MHEAARGGMKDSTAGGQTNFGPHKTYVVVMTDDETMTTRKTNNNK
jgi:hypothetical protein